MGSCFVLVAMATEKSIEEKLRVYNLTRLVCVLSELLVVYKVSDFKERVMKGKALTFKQCHMSLLIAMRHVALSSVVSSVMCRP